MATTDSDGRERAGIEVEGLVREFKNGPRAVDGIDLRVAPGEIYGFLGPNGAGKSTTVLMLTTLLPPTAGTARVAGFDIVREGAAGARRDRRRAAGGGARPAAHRQRAHAPADRAARAGQGRARRRARRELLARVGLSEAADRKVGGYSGGMKRRLDLALALVHRPRILFLDEPTTGLDIQSRTALWDEVARLASEDGVTVFLTTQYLEEADALADRVGIIDHGQHRRRGHARPSSRPRSAGRRSRRCPRDPADQERVERALQPFGERVRRHATAAAPRSCSPAASRSSPTSSARSTPRGSRSSSCSSTRPRSTTSSSPRPAARWRAPATEAAEADSEEMEAART